MGKVTLPTPESNPGVAEWAEVYANDRALREVVNGGIDSENLKKEGTEDASLKSPNNSVYRQLLLASGFMKSSAAANTYILGAMVSGVLPTTGQNLSTSTAYPPPVLLLASSDYAVGSKTQKLRIRAQVSANATKPTIKFTFGLYPYTVAGGSGEIKATLGSVVAGSTLEFNEPAASTVTQKVNEDFTLPADGVYVLGVVTSGTLTENAAVLLSAQLQTRHA